MSSLRAYIYKVWEIVPWREVFAWLPVAGMLMLISSLPFGWTVYQKVSIFVLGISTGFYYISNEQWKRLSWDKSKWVFVSMLLLYALIPIRQMFDPTPMTDYAWRQLHLSEWWLYVGLAGLVGFTPKLKLRYVAYVMLVTGVLLFLMRHEKVHSHMVLNLYVNVGLVFGFLALQEENELWKRIALIAGMVLNWLVVITSLGRVGMITSLIVLSVGILSSLKKNHRYIALIAGALVVAGGIWSVMHNSRFSREAFHFEPRVAIWDYSWRLIKEKPIVGYGISSLEEEFIEGMYQDEGTVSYFIPVIYNDPKFEQQGKTMLTHHPHNAFLMHWLCFGIAGVAALVLFFVVAAYMPVGRNRIYLCLVLMAILLQAMTEPVGDHLRPQFIAFMLWIIQLTLCSLPQSERSAVQPL
ncbi:MAG: O-antigen ligase family protein [Paludibacteraceae bacterium]|nr:O-antigen ligase family protein [Paludibacteraceae bacterium]